MASEFRNRSGASFGSALGAEWCPPTDSGLREVGVAFFWALVLVTPFLGIGGWGMYKGWRERAAAIAASQAYERMVAAPPGALLPLAEATRGRDLFASVCVACHGPTGTGLDGLGKNLVESDFVASRTDQELRQFIVTGRPNAQPVAMPPKAGHDDLTEDDIRCVAIYLRGMQDPRRLPELPAVAIVVAAITEAEKAQALEAAGGDAELAGYIANGNKLFHTVCIACHGKGGVGIAGNGKPLVKNPFVQSLNDDDLLAFIKHGRDPSDPKNTTGVGMPPKGGNPALSDDDLLDVIAFVRTLQGTKPTASVSK